MLNPGELSEIFQTYWRDMENCARGKAYWSLLHVTVCLPDICAALRSSDGQASHIGYKEWCAEYLRDAYLNGSERYKMRCKILHQGTARIDNSSRYHGFAFGQPSSSGAVDHGRADGGILHIDVGRLAVETKEAILAWIQALEANPTSPEAELVSTHLKNMVRVADAVAPQAGYVQGNYSVTGIGPTISKTN